MWGNQPGVSLDNKGRVISLSLEGFGAKGRVPDAIGQLTELRVLSLGSHNEKLGGRYEFVLTTHTDKDHVHNHLICAPIRGRVNPLSKRRA